MTRPMTKRSVPYFTADNAVHFRVSGTLTSLEDPDGRVLALLRLMDGQREPGAIWRELHAAYQDVTRDDVDEAIADLDESGLIQDGSDTGEDFDAGAKERWSCNLGFFETYASLAVSKYEYQRRIRDTKVAVLGIGGVGTHVLLDLVAIGFTDVRIVDCDVVELSNLNRQILYGEPFLGQPKVYVAADRARAFNGGLRLDAHDTRLGSAEDVYRMVADRDIVVGTADNPKLQITHWLNEGCVRAGAALVTGGVDTQRAYWYTVVPGVTGCENCWYQSAQRSDPVMRMVQREQRAIIERGEKLGEETSAFNGMVAVLGAGIVGEVTRLASRVTRPVSAGRVLEADFGDPRIRATETFERLPGCRICGDVKVSESLRWLADDDRPLPF